jgi:DNA-binding MarR family transcriptional regulator
MAKSSSDFTSSLEPFGPPLIGALLRVPWEAVQRRMLERLHDGGFGDFDAAHLAIFQWPGPQGARPTELAERLRMSKQAVGYHLRQLERLGYLEREPDPEDQRGKRIVVTNRGRRAIALIREAVAEVEDEWAGRLGADRFAQLRGCLQELVDAPPSTSS